MTYFLSLDGHTGYVEIPNSSDLSISKDVHGNIIGITIYAEIKPSVLDFAVTEGTADKYVNFIGKNNPDNRREWALRIYNNTSSRPNRISGYVFTPSVSLGVGSYFQDVLNTNENIKITFVVDVTNTYIYKNGILRDCDCYVSCTGTGSPCKLSSEAPVYPSHTTSPLRIGTDYLKSFFQGNIYEVRIYNRSLTKPEVLKLNNGTFVDKTNLVLWHNYRLGNSIDQSGRGNDGTLYGGAKFSYDGSSGQNVCGTGLWDGCTFGVKNQYLIIGGISGIVLGLYLTR